MLKQGAKFLNDQQHAHMSDEVVYRREGFDDLPINARVGRTESDSINNSGMVVQHRERDFIIQTTDLMFDGLLTKPRRGDVIVETAVDGTQQHYDIIPSNDESVWEWADEHRYSIRIHTKYLKSEEV